MQCSTSPDLNLWCEAAFTESRNKLPCALYPSLNWLTQAITMGTLDNLVKRLKTEDQATTNAETSGLIRKSPSILTRPTTYTQVQLTLAF